MKTKNVATIFAILAAALYAINGVKTTKSKVLNIIATLAVVIHSFFIWQILAARVAIKAYIPMPKYPKKHHIMMDGIDKTGDFILPIPHITIVDIRYPTVGIKKNPGVFIVYSA